MKNSPINEIARTLGKLRRRMMTQLFFERLTVCALGFSAVVVAVSAFGAMHGTALPDVRAVVVAILAVTFFSLIWTFAKAPTLRQAAIRADARAQTFDRLLTAYAFSTAENPTALQHAAVEECRRFVASFDAAACTPFHAPPLLRWLAVPLAALAMLAWHSGFNRAAVTAKNAPHADDPRFLEMEKLAHSVAQANEKVKSDDLKKIAEEIRKGAERLRSAQPGDAAQKAALGEMSSLENMLREMLAAHKDTSPEELAALAAALKQSAQMRDAASALDAGRPGDAAEKLQQLLKQQHDATQLDKTAQDIQQALAGLPQSQQGALSREMAQAAKSGAGNGAQALQRLAELLRKAGDAQQGQGGGNSQQSRQAMQNILSALQNMKYGSQQTQSGAGREPMSGLGKTLVQSFGTATDGGQPLSAANSPSGSPGSEHDTGTTENPFGAQQKKSAESGAGAQLSGVMGEGESLHDFISSTGDTSKSARSYRALYDAMLPAAEAAVEQEEIPLGSRFYIRRYFQSIRPKE